MKKISRILFSTACILTMSIPFVCMTFAKTDTTSENRVLTPFPAIKDEEGQVNKTYLEDLGNYYKDHFAFRNQMVLANANLMSGIFKVSAVSGVLEGTDGWLYYTDSLDDYMGRDVLSEQAAYHMAQDLKIVQSSLQMKGIQFAYTIAPNKNTLYPEHMPYYMRVKQSEDSSVEKLEAWMEKLGVSYIDLFTPFKAENEVLYRTQDSHWNQKGAVLAYNTILDGLMMPHDNLAQAAITPSCDAVGDLASMLYGSSAKPDADYKYDVDDHFRYVTETNSWEDFLIKTECEGKLGNLLMFRDSFGNTLSPLLANAYGAATFSKNTVYLLDSYVLTANPDVVLMEVVQRNLKKFVRFDLDRQAVSGPPVMSAPEVSQDIIQKSNHISVTEPMDLRINPCEQMPAYTTICGDMGPSDDLMTHVYVQVEEADGMHVYEAYTVELINSDEEVLSENGFVFYLPQEVFAGDVSAITVYKSTE